MCQHVSYYSRGLETKIEPIDLSKDGSRRLAATRKFSLLGGSSIFVETI